MNVFNVYFNCSLVDGEVKQVWYYFGKFVNVDLVKVLIENECNVLYICIGDYDVICVQVVGLIVCCIFCYVEVGVKLVCGQCYGFICFGLCVDVYLLIDSCVKVIIGDKVSVIIIVLVEFL